MNMPTTPPPCKVCLESIDSYLDLRDEGFTDLVYGYQLIEDDRTLCLYVLHSLTEDWIEDHVLGTHSYMVKSSNGGATWQQPKRITLGRVTNPNRESLIWYPLIRTRMGSVLYAGSHTVPDEAGKTCDMAPGRYTQIYGRRAAGTTEDQTTVVEWPPGTFMHEGFMERGLQLISGRLIFTMWGSAKRGDNWRSGVMISDNDGQTWRFVTNAYEPDRSIRDDPQIPAGFNEQTLFLTRENTLVTIIRGREGLGRGVPGGGDQDTWFFRSESNDEGETWSDPEPTNLPGTGATFGQGLTLPDGSLLIACRVPYSRDYYKLPEPDLFGLNLARSFDDGRSWTSEYIIQHDHQGNPFNTHHCAMNGYFQCVKDNRYQYIFGFFGQSYTPKLQRLLKLDLVIKC